MYTKTCCMPYAQPNRRANVSSSTNNGDKCATVSGCMLRGGSCSIFECNASLGCICHRAAECECELELK